MTLKEVINLWDHQADEVNKWEYLSSDEQVEWALKCKLEHTAVRGVIIGGVKYIPANEVLANETIIAKGLLLQFWGCCDNKKAKELADDGDIFVYVNDCGEGNTLRSVLDDIAEIAGENE